MAVKSYYNDGIYELRKKSVTADSATTVLDLSDATFFDISLEADTTLQLDNPLKGVYTITVDQTAAYTLSFPANVLFPNGIYTGISAVEDKKSDVFTLIYDGTYFYASQEGTLVLPYLLDNFQGAAAAYSLRDLSSDNIGQPVVRVRRSSDNAEANFTAAEVADGTLTSWTGAGDGFVTTWHDQAPKEIYRSDFTSGNEDLVETLGTATDGVSIGGENNVYEFTADGTVGVHKTRIENLIPIDGRRYRLKLKYYLPSTNTVINRLNFLNAGTSNLFETTTDQWVEIDVGGTASISNDFDITMYADAVNVIAAAGDKFYLKDVEIYGFTDYKQTVAASQPKIVNAGSLITSNGYNVINFDGIDDNLNISALTATGTMLLGGSDASELYEVNISGSYNYLASASLTKHPLNATTQIIWNRALSEDEKTKVKSFVTWTDWDWSNVLTSTAYFRNRTELISVPFIDLSNSGSTQFLFFGCSNLIDVADLDLSSSGIYDFLFFGCSSLVNVPNIIFRSTSTNSSFAFTNCTSIVTFPSLNIKASTAGSIFRGCTSLTNFPANVFDGSTATNFTNAFNNTNLTQTSIDNILVSIESNGTSNGTFNQSGGSAPSAVGEAAIDSLRARGWTVTVTGGY